ncbi:MAG: hypothetical protein KDB35_09355 [Acidimicrobiales bacterium]|nr:hypothetical protein [Acidimicrobiales bacterium]MCB1015666.1 hypothetical protein [Acidimicrobiales bacterium]
MTGRRRRVAFGLVVAVTVALAACSSDGEGLTPDRDAFCSRLEEFNTGTQAFDLNVADDAEVDRIAQLLDEIEQTAPDEIRADVEARFAYVDDVIAASRGDEDATARLAEATPTDEEQARIDAYAQQECGIVLSPATSAPPTTSGVVPAPSVPTTAPADPTVTDATTADTATTSTTTSSSGDG